MSLGLRCSIFCFVAMSFAAVGMAQSTSIPPNAPGYVSLDAKQRSDRFFKGYLGSPLTPAYTKRAMRCSGSIHATSAAVVAVVYGGHGTLLR
jgi:hypothetical protein